MNRTVRLVIAIVVGVLLLALLTLAALPYWFGHRAEKAYRALLDELTLAIGQPVTLKRYERGWRYSEAEADIVLPDLSLTLTARHTLQHGPWTDDGWAPLLARVAGDIRFTSTANHPVPVPLTLRGGIGLRGTAQLSFDWPAAQLAWTGGSLQWQPMRGTLHTDRDGNRVQGQLDTPALQVGEWRAERWQARFDIRPNETAFPFGQLNLDIGRLAFTPAWEVDALQLSVSSRPTGETVTLKIGGQLEKLRMAGESYGPGEFALEARTLEPVALMQFVRALPALFRADATVAKLTPPLAALARKTPEVELTALHLKATPDALIGRGRIVLDGRRLGPTPHPARLLSVLSGELTLSVSTPLLTSWLLADIQRNTATEDENDADQKRHLTAEALPRYLAAHPYARLLVPADEYYRFAASLKQGRLLINNEPWHGQLLPAP
ncbi:MAG: DUF945 family protein [Gammaproteobacteria bacterium]|nr:DUF945 family protein [Gammaproteobacteria bacterium]